MHLVLQRYRHCRILLREEEWVSVGVQGKSEQEKDFSDDPADESHCGLLVYVSFAAGCTRSMVANAAETIVNLPLLTTGLWGDGTSEPRSLLDFVSMSSTSKALSSVVLCPQANLISKIRGKSSLTYRGQCAKDEGHQLFSLFACHVMGFLLERQSEIRESTLPPNYLRWKEAWVQEQQQESYRAQQQQRLESQPDPSIDPKELFRQTKSDMYYAFDDEGMPTLDAEGQPLAKSAIKKLKKLRDAHAKRHDKWLLQQAQEPQNTADDKTTNAPTAMASENSADASKETEDDPTQIPEWTTEFNSCRVVVGSFGKRQGLSLESDMGPFCHVLQL